MAPMNNDKKYPTVEERFANGDADHLSKLNDDRRKFLKDMRDAINADVGYKWMMIVIEWEMLYREGDPDSVLGPEFWSRRVQRLQRKIDDLERGTAPEERRLRLDTTVALSAELAKILDVYKGPVEVAIAEEIVQGVVDGRWNLVEETANELVFKDDAKMTDLWCWFRAVALSAVDKHRDANGSTADQN
jgi:hypothetical protein